MDSRVLAATPPSVPEAGEGRTKAFGSADRRAMRVLSARIDPPVRLEEGSTASTATLRPCAVRKLPSASMVVDLPTPGVPVMPTRTALPVAGSTLVIGAPALHQRGGARYDGALAGPDAACQSCDVRTHDIGTCGLGSGHLGTALSAISTLTA